MPAGCVWPSARAWGQWTVNQWVKKAVLLSFRLNDNKVMRAGDLEFFDKVPTKFAHLDEDKMRATGVRVVPPAVARRGSYIAKGAVLMPSYVNIGAYVDENTMVDTWATVGSCAQIGKNVHLSGGVGIGGVLEAAAGQPDHHRGQLLHRGALRGRRRGSSSRRTRSSRWVSTSARAPRSTTAPPAR